MIKAIFTNGVDEITAAGLTQWDTGRKLKIQLSDLPAIFQVHFANYKCSKDAYVVDATSSDGVATVPIPNIILQQASRAVAWVYIPDGNGSKTIKTIYIPIQGRAKPTDYVYTEEEIRTVEAAMARVNEALANIVSPTAKVEQTSSGAIITVTDEKNGTTTATINHGKDGYTPVKGVDYFTDADKEEFVESVLAAIPTAEGVSF